MYRFAKYTARSPDRRSGCRIVGSYGQRTELRAFAVRNYEKHEVCRRVAPIPPSTQTIIAAAHSRTGRI